MGIKQRWNNWKEQELKKLDEMKYNVVTSVMYEGRYPGFDFRGYVYIRLHDGIVTLKPSYGKVAEVTFLQSDILGIKLERASSRSAGKAAAGALIGGALTGGIGMLAGAAIGGSKKDESYVVMRVNYYGSELELIFTGKDIRETYQSL